MAAAKKKAAQQSLIVKSVSEQGRWRAGLHFTREEQTVEDLTDEQVEAISSDPMLIVKEAK